MWRFLDSRPGHNIKVQSLDANGVVVTNIYMDPAASRNNLPAATFSEVKLKKGIEREDPDHLSTFLHELAHIYTLTTDMADFITEDGSEVASVGMALVYMNVEHPNGGGISDRQYCEAHELLADLILYVVMKDAKQDVEDDNLSDPFNLFTPSDLTSIGQTYYWRFCDDLTNNLDGDPSAADEALAREMLAGNIPAWFATEYSASGSDIHDRSYDVNAAKLWRHVRAFQVHELGTLSYRVVPVNYFSTLFGGYCSNSGATNEAKTKGTPAQGRNPWANDGCPINNPGGIVLEAGSGTIDVNWNNSRNISLDWVDEIEIQWKAAGEDYSDDVADGRTATVTQGQLPYSITGTAGTQLTVRLRLVSGSYNSRWVEKSETVGS